MNCFKRITAILLTIIMTGLMTPVSASLTANVNDTKSIPAWTLNSQFSESGVYIDKDTAADGEASLKLKHDGIGTGYCQAYTSVPVEAGKNYRLEFYAKAEDARGTDIAFDWAPRYSLIPIAPNYDWQQFKFIYTAAETTSVIVRFLCVGKTKGLWIDNVKFYDVSKPDINLIQNGTFEGFDAPMEQKVQTEFDPEMYLNVYKKTITVDGKLDDWNGIQTYEIKNRHDLMEDYDNIITGNARYSYDDKNFYFAIEVNDPVHYMVDGFETQYWNSDSLQFAFALPTAANQTHTGVAWYPNTIGIYNANDYFTSEVSRNGDITVYEVAIPWTAISNGVVPDELLYNAIVNNNDGNGREYCIEIDTGMSNGRSLAKFRHLFMWLPVGEAYYRIGWPTQDLSIGDKAEVTVTLMNPTSANKTIKVESKSHNFAQNITLKPGERKGIVVPFTSDVAEDIKVDIALSADGTTVNNEETFPFYYNEAEYIECTKRIDAYAAELKEMLLKCENMGLTCDYEIASHAIICKFRENMEKMDAAQKDYKYIKYYEEGLTKIYEEAKANLNSYIKGESKPKAVPRYQTGGFRLDGTTVYGTMDTNGVKEERPMFFVGPGHWTTSVNEIPFFAKLGFNYTSTAIYMTDVLKTINSAGWSFDNLNDGAQNAEIVEEDAGGGKFSIKFSNSAGWVAGKHRRIRQELNLKPNTDYEFGLKAKGDGANIFVSLDGLANVPGRKVPSNTTDWTEYNWVQNSGDAPNGQYNIYIANQATDLYLDDIYVREKGTDVNLLKNGDFEYATRELTPAELKLADMGFYIDRAEFDRYEEAIKRAEENNFMLQGCVSITHIPDFVYDLDPEIGSASYHFMPYAIDNETLRDFFDIWAEVSLDVQGDTPAIQDIMGSNEPKVFTYQSEHYVPSWIEFLKNRYGTVEKLNETWGADYNYTSFDEINMPKIEEPTPLYADYMDFNDEVMNDFLKWYTEAQREKYPDLLYHHKVMQHIRYDYKNYLTQGTNLEILSDYVDLNGCDGWSDMNNWQRPMQLTMAWNDMMISLKDAPVWDTETHITTDNAVIIKDDIDADYAAANVWNGAVHGRGAAQVWTWDDTIALTPWKNPTMSSANMIFQPLTTYEISKTAMDMNRLSYELTAIAEEEPEVGIIFSRLNMFYNSDYVEKFDDAYRNIIYSGQKVGVVTDTRPEDMHKYKLLVVPETTNVTEDMMNNIKTYIENGGQVVITGEGALTKTKYNKPHNSALVDYIYKNADTTSSVADKIQAMNMSDVMLIDAETGKKVYGVEWSYAEYNGNIVVNILNYHNDTQGDKTVKIMYKGNEVKEYTELRSDEKLAGELTLKPYCPVLVQFGK